MMAADTKVTPAQHTAVRDAIYKIISEAPNSSAAATKLMAAGYVDIVWALDKLGVGQGSELDPDIRPASRYRAPEAKPDGYCNYRSNVCGRYHRVAESPHLDQKTERYFIVRSGS